MKKGKRVVLGKGYLDHQADGEKELCFYPNRSPQATGVYVNLNWLSGKNIRLIAEILTTEKKG